MEVKYVGPTLVKDPIDGAVNVGTVVHHPQRPANNIRMSVNPMNRIAVLAIRDDLHAASLGIDPLQGNHLRRIATPAQGVRNPFRVDFDAANQSRGKMR
jgi:hypothetical protein